MLHLLLVLDRLPALCLLCGVAAHVAYLYLLKPFPYISLQSPTGLAALGLMVLSTLLWVRHFLKTYYTGGRAWHGEGGGGGCQGRRGR